MSTEKAEIVEKELLQAVINAVPAPIFYKDAEGRYLGCNKAFERYTGKSLGELYGKGVFELFDKELAEVYFEADQALYKSGASQVYEAKVGYADGSVHDVMFHKAVFHAEQENVSGIVGVILDITERKKAEQRYQELAFKDALTGLDNRYSLLNKIDHSLDRAKRREGSISMLMLDLDDFKASNDIYGHPIGDKYLIEVAKRIAAELRQSDIIARLGGDEFAIVLEDVEDEHQAEDVAKKIIHSFSQDLSFEGETITMSASIGIAFSPRGAASIDDLMKNADIALYAAKGRGKGQYCLYSESIK